MAFKMKGYQAHNKSPLKVDGKWSDWTGDRQKFIGDEIQARRKAKGGTVKKKDEDKKTETTPVVDTKTTPVVNTNTTPVVDNTTPSGDSSGRVEWAKKNMPKNVVTEKGEIVDGEYVAGESGLQDYETAFNDMDVTYKDGNKMRINPENQQLYPDTPEGLKQFETASEEHWKKEEEKKKQNLNIDSQTNQQSTHAVWDNK